MTVYARRAALGLMASAFVAAVVAPASAQVFVERAPPADIVEVIPATPPHPGWHWVPGHYAWRGGWVWLRGHFVAFEVPPRPEIIVETPPPAPSPRHFWVRGHWVFEGRDWAWHKGHWVRG